MKDYDSRSRIGGEGFPSRDHTGQGEERIEAVAGGFQLTESREKCSIVNGSCRTIFPYMYVGASGDMRVYASVTKGRCVHLKNRVVQGSYSGIDCTRFVCSCMSLNGPLSLLQEP
jgi:hypothetical protein